mmetsp:Transcript_43896/g.127810  ORF Transcript_43896/g.127810 Transcript_43896/m.127810 type:complete len:241 (-) Transcript_43896:562-1284(-)
MPSGTLVPCLTKILSMVGLRVSTQLPSSEAKGKFSLTMMSCSRWTSWVKVGGNNSKTACKSDVSPWRLNEKVTCVSASAAAAAQMNSGSVTFMGCTCIGTATTQSARVKGYNPASDKDSKVLRVAMSGKLSELSRAKRLSMCLGSLSLSTKLQEKFTSSCPKRVPSIRRPGPPGLRLARTASMDNVEFGTCNALAKPCPSAPASFAASAHASSQSKLSKPWICHETRLVSLGDGMGIPGT